MAGTNWPVRSSRLFAGARRRQAVKPQALAAQHLRGVPGVQHGLAGIRLPVGRKPTHDPHQSAVQYEAVLAEQLHGGGLEPGLERHFLAPRLVEGIGENAGSPSVRGKRVLFVSSSGEPRTIYRIPGRGAEHRNRVPEKLIVSPEAVRNTTGTASSALRT